MVHTFELSKTIYKNTFYTIINSLKIKNYGSCLVTSAYKDKGFTLIRLYKFQRKDIKTKVIEDSDFTHHYMISLSINTANMFGGNGDPHLSQNILSFTPDYVSAIYYKIFELIPCLEVNPECRFNTCWKEVEDCNIVKNEILLNKRKELYRKWLKSNAFKARRIDFAFDLKYMNQQYLALINRGYSLRKDVYERNYYDNEEPDISDNEETFFDEEPDIPDSEEILKMLADDESDSLNDEESKDNYSADVDYVYIKSKSVTLNIYHKQTEIEKEQLASNPDTDYDFLRIEVQVKKSKLNSIVTKYKLNKGELGGRELQYLMSPEVEQYILSYYVNRLTGAGLYVTYDRAMKVIDESGYTKTKKARLKKVIEAVTKKHGIAKVLEQVEKGMITDLGKLSTVEQYLRDIHNLDINPVTISARMGVPKQILENQSGGKDLSERVLPSLVDILTAYGDQMKDYQKNGMPITDEAIEQIMKS